MPTQSALCSTCELHAEAVFRVEGMDCSEEVVILERRLKPLAGLEAVAADLIGQRLHVKYDAARLTTSTIVDAVGDTGMRMWLEHEEPTAYGGALEWRWRLVIGAGIALAAGASLSALGFPDLSAALCLAAAVLGGVYPARRAVAALRSRSLDINALMVIAVTGAIALGDWTEAASVVLLFAIAQWLEVRTLDRARRAIRSLMDLSPPEALVVRDGRESRVKVDEVTIGERMIVKPGEKISLDGVVVAGHSDVNEAPITGESLPVDKAHGDEVYAGAFNGRGALDVRVTRHRRDTRLARIIALVETAQGQRAPVQAFVERFARVYTPVVVGLAAGVAAIPVLAGGDASTWMYRALVLLVVACPCALVISTPVSVVAALAGAARHGVLIKGGVYLERLAAIRAVAFDKTGTLTHGHPHVVAVLPVDPHTADDIIATAAALEMRSEHPIARAITAYAEAEGVRAAAGSDVVALPGMGTEGNVGGRVALLGNERLMASRGYTVPAGLLESATGSTPVLLAVDGQVIGAIAVADRLRETGREAVELLRHQGVATAVMLTGDHESAAAVAARALGLDGYRAGLLPDQKYAAIAELRSTYGPVLMVGDGINDAPALAAADVGVAMGAASSDAALETADVALMSGELLKLPYAMRLARATLRNIRANIAVSLSMKAAFLAMALAGTATLWMAILADTGASVIVVVNALRLLRAR